MDSHLMVPMDGADFCFHFQSNHIRTSIVYDRFPEERLTREEALRGD